MLLLSSRLLDTFALAIWLYRAAHRLSFRSVPTNIKTLHSWIIVIGDLENSYGSRFKDDLPRVVVFLPDLQDINTNSDNQNINIAVKIASSFVRALEKARVYRIFNYQHIKAKTKLIEIGIHTKTNKAKQSALSSPTR